MIRVAISVEGNTEEGFVNDVLCGPMNDRDIFLTPINMCGNIGLERVVTELSKLHHNFDCTTTFYDFYGFKKSNQFEHGDDLEAAIRDGLAKKLEQRHQALDSRRFRPYIQMHEFEGLLFSDVAAFNLLPGIDAEQHKHLQAIRSGFETPEDINNSKETAPSKRIAAMKIGYDKAAHAAILALDIGLPKIRAECPRFNAWLNWLENLEKA